MSIEREALAVAQRPATRPGGHWTRLPVDRQRVGDVTTLYGDDTAVLAYAHPAQRADALQQWHPEREVTALGIQRSAGRIGLDQHKIAGL